jgi:putative addiction module killer protein
MDEKAERCHSKGSYKPANRQACAWKSGDVEPIGDGCSEMRIDYGPGYRVYYKDIGREIIIILCGGDKSTQQKDINKAKRLAREEEEEDDENE